MIKKILQVNPRGKTSWEDLDCECANMSREMYHVYVIHYSILSCFVFDVKYYKVCICVHITDGN